MTNENLIILLSVVLVSLEEADVTEESIVDTFLYIWMTITENYNKTLIHLVQNEQVDF